VAQRVKDIEQDAIPEHKARFKDPEEPFVAENGASRVRGGLGIKHRDGGGGEILGSAVDGADGDDGTTAVKHHENTFQLLIAHAATPAVSVELCGHADEEGHGCDLQQ